MSRLINFLQLLLLTGCATAGTAQTVTLDSKRTLEVIDVIDGSALELAEKVNVWSAASSDPIWVLINSPGGMTVPGYVLADSLQQARQRGVTVHCVVGVLAASMAFQLLAYCDERYALPHANLLFHPVRVLSQNGFTPDEMETTLESLRSFEARSTRENLEMMGMDADSYRKHYRQETMWTAVDLLAVSSKAWLHIVTSIQGTSKAFTLTRQRVLSPFQSAPATRSRPVPVLGH